MALLGVCLSACVGAGFGTSVQPPIYDVREVAVIGQDTMPGALLAGTDRRVRASIESTRRLTPMERVVLTVKYQRYRAGGKTPGDPRAMAEFIVTAADIESGLPVAAGTFVVHARTGHPAWAAESLAEEAASRIRFAFSLRPPDIGEIARTEPSPMETRTVQTAYAPVGSGMPDETVFEVNPVTGQRRPLAASR
ncbi:hypothetical protein [Rhizobium halophytocola]|uniref:DUF3313 family protein n=1 Tax=Rhizobium halophytocola TaxID=735519 RepID=A0ABS4DZH5_9HYPH|nr:hypothetical protein [Rhizobium halophytocola]MBP1851096.1 hypothetical protein [Rhizobium halophytocola]